MSLCHSRLFRNLLLLNCIDAFIWVVHGWWLLVLVIEQQTNLSVPRLLPTLRLRRQPGSCN